MAWEVEVADQFVEWWETLTDPHQEAITAGVLLLQEFGPAPGRPTVDRISGSRHHNMKELRTSRGGALRILFAFDQRRMAILLIGGNKAGRWNEWYTEAIPLADDLYDEHLDELRREGLI